MIDAVEVGKPVSPHIRLAFEVDDASHTTTKLVEDGASLIAGPLNTPWRSLNSRMDAPGTLQLTLFSEQASIDERERSTKFDLHANRSATTEE